MAQSSLTEESHSLRGPIDRSALITIRDIIDESEPLATPALDDYLHLSVLEASLADGLCNAESGRIDVQWTTRGDYKFHYTDSARGSAEPPSSTSVEFPTKSEAHASREGRKRVRTP